jgi:ATP-dependent DNA helicase RecG
VDAKEGSELRAASAMAKRLGADVLAAQGPRLDHCRVGLVHGRMKSIEKAEAMAAFRNGDLEILVATTVIEVGIDIPRVTALVVEHAERFGLSQLHQLRGRIGRGPLGGTCVLMAGETLTDAARLRLEAIETERSGFRIAEIDLDLRGPGDLLGTRQAGAPMLRVADLVRDRALIEEARREAFAMVDVASPGGTSEPRGLIGRIPHAWRETIGLGEIP